MSVCFEFQTISKPSQSKPLAKYGPKFKTPLDRPELIVILGFGFHQQNMELLTSRTARRQAHSRDRPFHQLGKLRKLEAKHPAYI